MSNTPRDKGLNQKERIDEVTNIKELQKQGVRDEQGRIAISNTEADENFESERHKNDRDEDVKSGSESNASSDADGGTGVIRIENLNRKKSQLLQRLTSLNAFFADTSEPVSLFTHEREKIEKDQQQQNYQNLHPDCNTEQAQADLSSNVDDEAIRTKEKK
ncbi:28 kDa heat- and acid-stable phosphoprotein-like [Myzus persicae]|uniref:28 kDa heat- and acid-stable phosphoprotein-like n=1 Tax=Myzus persicae TaxID=13164 RepID=UPI000B932EA2|nr:28 kDa heat- and acid-stable phosphoprotein-like [Myzus persicae]